MRSYWVRNYWCRGEWYGDYFVVLIYIRDIDIVGWRIENSRRSMWGNKIA